MRRALADTEHVFERGLVRLLADHCVLRYRLKVTLWSMGPDLTRAQLELVRSDACETDLNIDGIGQRIGEIGGAHPSTLSVFSRLVSITCDPARQGTTACLRGLQGNHTQIAHGIAMLKLLIHEREDPLNRQLLCRLLDVHRSAASRLGKALH